MSRGFENQDNVIVIMIATEDAAGGRGRPHCSVMVVKLVLSQSERTELGIVFLKCDASPEIQC